MEVRVDLFVFTRYLTFMARFVFWVQIPSKVRFYLLLEDEKLMYRAVGYE